LDDASLNQNRDLPVEVDWRDLLSSAMRDAYGFDKAALNRIFPGRPGKNWG
ncbi:MAG: hypothetical protein JOZ06_00495, partial [Paludibacterium sp.]|nr:hypothetical protein [Paludibacterium sp.]